ncbi:RNHCP domain-containing protein [Nocardiopsis lambiniae]|uniref:RNHCP domain-containing protein n=1 Tax=Nocardiopsis lambiniae TaxID=3075539 RepID=A0ABU2M5P1_9ACTN|nr:RNHCP domain-containing protein [Nocardiopsis sp. DSM 44743]MDT0327925.1 RNHCP domain-containing protein [Nocardiopsis sp. DSM 44743]
MSTTEPSPTPRALTFDCVRCGLTVSALDPDGRERDHCPGCLSSRHVVDHDGDGASACDGRMVPLSIAVPRGGVWVLVHRCVRCDELAESAVAADDNPLVLMRIAVRPLADPPFPLDLLGEV